MFRRQVRTLGDVLWQYLRREGLETPLLQKRLIDNWEEVAGSLAARFTEEKFIRNQTLFVKISRPALRQDLNMMRSDLIVRLNQSVGAQIISDLRIY
jgi:predicted nucleic acid-binding Zn ribbon protein